MKRIDIATDGVLGVVFEPDSANRGFVVVLTGSSGGVPEGAARRLAEHGLTTFALGYFGAPGLQPALVDVPVELLQRGIALFRDRFSGGRPVGILGWSKGAELALTLAARSGDAVGPVVAVAPSHVAWFGLEPFKPDRPSADRRSTHSSWTHGGASVPFLPFFADVAPLFTRDGFRTDAFFDLPRYEPADVDAARIRVENATGPLLLLSGDDDHMCPAAAMAGEIVKRMEEHGRAGDTTNVIYPSAGHVFLQREFMPASSDRIGPPFDFGGNIEADAAASRDAWPRIASFLGS